MKVADIIDAKGKEVVSIDAHSSVEDAIRLMDSSGISALIVTEKGSTAGIFTERDVVRCYLASEGKSFKEMPLKDSITPDLIVAEMENDLSEIMSIMVEKNIRHIPVIVKEKIIGMLSSRDIIQIHVNKMATEIHYLRDYITGI
ncbi:MAG: CBS domain-containing protein [Nitrospirae bacterium]|nr:CBS domain-containing protein [Nitrospirota bacterium]